jgi:hypothetical protein
MIGLPDIEPARRFEEGDRHEEAHCCGTAEPGVAAVLLPSAAWIDANPDQVEALQNSIEENGELAAELRARSVQLNNVVAIQQAMNGNLIVYLR